jgi:hypothetical protein
MSDSLQHNMLDNKVTYTLADLLADNHSLQKLDLSHNNLGDDGVSTLADAIASRNQSLVEVKYVWLLGICCDADGLKTSDISRILCWGVLCRLQF